MLICSYLSVSVAAHITIQHKQGTKIAIAIRSPSTQHLSTSNGDIFYAFFFVILKCASLVSVCTSAPSPSSMPIPTLSPSPLPPLSSTQIPSQTIGVSSSWGPMMMPGEVQELLALEPQTAEYYAITKGHKPGIYLFW